MHDRFPALVLKRPFGFTAIPALIMLAMALPAALAQQPEEKFQRSFTLNPGGTLRVENFKGTIHVTASSSSQLVVNVVKRFEGGSESDRKWWMENTKVTFSNDSSRVAVKVDYPSWSCVFCWTEHDFTDAVELEIQAPLRTNLDLEGFKPDIRVSSVQGDVRIKSYKAPMTIESTTGAIHIDTYKDVIQLKNVATRGALDVHSFKADTEIDVKSLEGSARLETDKGRIVLRVPRDLGLDVDYSGGRRSGFHSDFPLNVQAGERWRHQDVRANINGGGAHVVLRTDKGSVSIEKRAGEL